VNEDIIIPIALFATVIVLATVVPMVRALIRRWDRQAVPLPSDSSSDARLARIEQAIEAMAIEVERISEGQRFMTKLSTARAEEAKALPREETSK
jgi:hypothetical protein